MNQYIKIAWLMIKTDIIYSAQEFFRPIKSAYRYVINRFK